MALFNLSALRGRLRPDQRLIGIDPGSKIAAVFMTQVLPFADSRALRLYHQFEHGIYAAVKAD